MFQRGSGPGLERSFYVDVAQEQPGALVVVAVDAQNHFGGSSAGKMQLANRNQDFC